jgi:Xaa-Pro aminopeptidase
MKSDIDRYMEEAGLEALFVIGAAAGNPPMVYFTGLAHLGHAELVKKRGEPPILFCQPMERDEAVRTGLRTRDISDYDPYRLLQEAGGDQTRAMATRYTRMLQEYGVRGRVALYGKANIGAAYAIFHQVQQNLSEIEFIGENDFRSVLTRARATKDADEVERIRKMGQKAVGVAGDVQEFLTSHRAKEGVLVNREGDPLTIGEVKRRINLWLALRGGDNPEGTIFAIGRDAGVPHSVGAEEAPVEIGKPIIFDFYPCEPAGGYFYDFTRTWCLGHAPEEVEEVFEDVRQAYESAIASLKPGMPCRDAQILVCQQFEAKGHPTVLTDPNTKEGYVHSLGHGVGLAVHEGPSFTALETNTDVLSPGSVVAIEPGLYYPDRGLGARLEDTVWIRPDGGVEILAEFPKDLVLKV